MKLLNKSEIIKNKSLERQQEIEEGAKLARRIDTLRETCTKEEANFSKFRDQSLKTIREEISALSAQRDEMQKRIEFLKEGNNLVIYGEIDVEWRKIRFKNREIEESHEKLYRRSKELDARQDQIDEAQRIANVDRNRLDAEKIRIRENLENSEESKKKSAEILEKSEKNRDDVEKSLKEKTQVLVVREASIATREKEVNLKIEWLAKEELRLMTKEREINDKYETLLRTTQRLKQ